MENLHVPTTGSATREDYLEARCNRPGRTPGRAKSPTYLPSYSDGGSHASTPPVFLSKGQPLPASLVRILLLRAGIHPNPGPTPGPTNVCPVCQLQVTWRSKSVRCSKCSSWCHLRLKNNCSQIKEAQYRPDYTCKLH